MNLEFGPIDGVRDTLKDYGVSIGIIRPGESVQTPPNPGNPNIGTEQPYEHIRRMHETNRNDQMRIDGIKINTGNRIINFYMNK